MKPTVRTAVEWRHDGSWELRTSDFKEFTEVVGAELLAAFAACFVDADRVVSLTTFIYLSDKEFPEKAFPGHFRNYLTLASLIVGCLHEFSGKLGTLKNALITRGLFDKTTWKDGLSRWEKWGRSDHVRIARNKFAFHLDPDLCRLGVESIAAQRGPFPLAHGSKELQRHSQFNLGSDVALEGLKRVQGSFDVLAEPAELLAITAPLDAEFLRVLDALSLKPVIVFSRGARS